MKREKQVHRKSKAAAVKTQPQKPTPSAAAVFPTQPQEWGLVALRECPVAKPWCGYPGAAAAYWRKHIPSHPYFNPECECLVVLALDTRRHVKGHYLVSIGLIDRLPIHAREVFRLAIIAGAQSIILCHNHPSGDPWPSESDIKQTRYLIRAGRFLKIEVLDHIIIGKPSHLSLWEQGYFAGRESGGGSVNPADLGRAVIQQGRALQGATPAADKKNTSESSPGKTVAGAPDRLSLITSVSNMLKTVVNHEWARSAKSPRLRATLKSIKALQKAFTAMATKEIQVPVSPTQHGAAVAAVAAS